MIQIENIIAGHMKFFFVKTGILIIKIVVVKCLQKTILNIWIRIETK